MKSILNLLDEKEKYDYACLANCLGITLEELLQLDFHNENLFDESGLATKVKYVFNESNPIEILHKIKGMSIENSIVLSADELNFRV